MPVTQKLAHHNIKLALEAILASSETLPGDCLRDCLPATCLTLLTLVGELISIPGANGSRVIDQAWADKVAGLLHDKFGHVEADVITAINAALADWTTSNSKAGGGPVPLV